LKDNYCLKIEIGNLLVTIRDFKPRKFTHFGLFEEIVPEICRKNRKNIDSPGKERNG